MLIKPSSCAACPGLKWGGHKVDGNGPFDARVWLVGEAPGAHEARTGQPFCGPSGELLDYLLKRAGLSRDSFHVTNCVRCRPPGNELRGASYEAGAIQHCSQYLDADLAAGRPKVIVAMGETALRRLTGMSSIMRYRGRPLPGPHGSWVIPTFHPSFFLPRNEGGVANPHRFIGAWILDLLKAQEIAQAGFVRRQFRTVEDPSPNEWAVLVQEFLQQPDRPLAWDIETPWKGEQDEEDLNLEDATDTTILRVSFCWDPTWAISVPWGGPYMEGIRALLASPAPKLSWNGDTFDAPLVRGVGVEVAGEQWDMMWAFQLWQSDLPRGLEAATAYHTDLLPWKHLNKLAPAYYSAVDSLATLQCALGLQAALTRANQWDLFLRHVVQLQPVLYQAGRQGVLIDQPAQVALREAILAERVKLVPQLLATVPPEVRVRKLYKRTPPRTVVCPACEGEEIPCAHCRDSRLIPAETELVYIPGVIKTCSLCGTVGVTKSGHLKGACKGGQILSESGPTPATNLIHPFNAGSSDQVKALVKFWGHPLGKPKRGQKKPGLDKTHLRKLVKRYGHKFPFYALLAEVKKLNKAIEWAIDGMRPDATGRVYTTYSQDPSSGRLSSRKVNFQNVSKHSSNPWAAQSRNVLIAPPGYVFLQADSSSIEAVFTGYFMGDPEYIALAKQGIHAAWCCQALGIPFTPENKALVKSKEHAELYNRKKRTVHGCLTGDHEVLTPMGWRWIDEVSPKQPIAQWDPGTGKLAFIQPKDYYTAPYTGEMLELSGTAFAGLMTPNHGLPRKTCAGHIARTDACSLGKATSVPVAGMLTGDTGVSLHARLAVAVQADGTLLPTQVKWHLKKPTKRLRLEQLLDDLQIAFVSRTWTDGSTTYTIARPAWLDTWMDAEKRFNLPYLLTCTEPCRKAFLEEIPYWDGNWATKRGTNRIYFTTSLHNAEAVQTVAYVTGHQAILRTITDRRPDQQVLYHVRFNRRTCVATECLTRKTVPYAGHIYCPVTDTGYFLVRHKGTIWISGNTSYGLGAKLMSENYPEIFPTERIAQDEIDDFYRFVPKLKAWHEQVRWQAHHDGYLVDPWNGRHYFYGVWWPRDGQLVKGPDANRAIAFKPQGSAGRFMKDTLLILADTWIGPYAQANLSVHDGYTYCIPVSRVEEGAQLLGEVLTRPIPQMQGLQVGCEIEVGENWGTGMKHYRTVEVA